MVALGTKGVTVSVGMSVAVGALVGVCEAVGTTIVAEGVTEAVSGAGAQAAMLTKPITSGKPNEWWKKFEMYIVTSLGLYDVDVSIRLNLYSRYVRLARFAISGNNSLPVSSSSNTLDQ